MNFLAHSMISFALEQTAPDSANTLFGNFAGDFYKGRTEHLAVESHIKDGVVLHRLIDGTADRKGNLLNPVLAQTFGIFKGIVADIVIDHFLAKEFQRLFQQDIGQTEAEILTHIRRYQAVFPPGFDTMFDYLVQNKSLSGYADLDFLAERVFAGMSRRVKRGEILLSAVDVLKAHYAELETLALREFAYTRDESIRKYRALKQAA
ncbi:acyl carrier protein phosphodiesterase [Neisseria sp. HSC-16F19]|nr:ACP phosphodiesterase [Neisseria sp. HSC-16F19]MCP2041565.1 acyl carrier protein phosphodiesterase [Neisseria sp. HSC-16F19]